MALCARKFLPHEDEVIMSCVAEAPSLFDGLRKAAAQLGRSFRSVESRYRRLKKNGVTLAQNTAQYPCEMHQTSAPATQSSMTRIIQRLINDADAVVIYAGDYECRIVRTKQIRLASPAKHSTG